MQNARLESNAADPVSILLVEDEGIIARDLEDTLTRLGYRVSGVASEGAEAIEMARELHPQLVVMDVSLRGEVDGIEAACAIQEDAPVPVIFLTGHTDTETLQRAVMTGPLGYLIKPFQEDDLRCAIEVAIHKHRSDVAAPRARRASAAQRRESVADRRADAAEEPPRLLRARRAGAEDRPARAAHAWRCSSWT